MFIKQIFIIIVIIIVITQFKRVQKLTFLQQSIYIRIINNILIWFII